MRLDMLALDRDGIVVLPEPLWVDRFVEFLGFCPTYPDHVRRVRTMPPVPVGAEPPVACYDMHDVICAPDFFDFAVQTRDVAAGFLKTDRPLLYSLNAFVTRPTDDPRPDIQQFHRDGDDSRFLVLFMYCTDVDATEDGAHQFVRGTHRDGVYTGETKTVCGPAGTMFFAATRGIHRGTVPRHRERMVAWARWGVSDPPESYRWDSLSPLPRAALGDRYPVDPVLQDAIHLVVS